MEKRYKEIDKERVIYERFVNVHPELKNWLKWVYLIIELSSTPSYCNNILLIARSSKDQKQKSCATAEQILCEAKERQESVKKAPCQKI
ncbi:hypothetical protein RhiirA4_483174 [Rhizophagus irregularis]|uniref:Uncharacterized protein n=1 Tax=Rhizophagus irregularis TaxID=588596 RepID=A0A2I1HM76_9GLOM|nr:hypothetical protein RhiirA4_483174 [Rhizophagus irregularis]